MTQVETATVIQNNEQFVNASYNGMTILVDQYDGYINATQFCQQYSNQFRSLIKYDRWKDYIKAEIDVALPEIISSGSLMYSIDKGIANDFKVELIKQDIDGKYYKVRRLHKNTSFNQVIKDTLNKRGINMKKLSFTIPNEQDDAEIMNLIRQTVTERSIH
ncbi:MAG: hypothetical protein EZS28_001428 [Streblomastix strix]|uniref:KilA-N domain-containing protein n=1 Tax=Streblomastix strix TaxID=222440 RepID=A0A5J4X966_9EUKA|nr:MAG: hypothetical protein EZS28_001428 [Streblomastix strix]